jgi:hypothetical protein
MMCILLRGVVICMVIHLAHMVQEGHVGKTVVKHDILLQ